MSRYLSGEWPVWLRDIDSLLAVHPHFVLTGNVRDWYPLPRHLVPGDAPVAETVGRAVQVVLTMVGFDVVLIHDVVDGYRVIADDEDAGWAAVQTVVGRDLRSTDGGDFEALAQVLQALAAGGQRRLATVLEDASRLTNRADQLQQPEVDLFRVATKVSRHAKRVQVTEDERSMFNPVFWVTEREHDLPDWFTAGNPGVRAISIPLPDLAEREHVATRLLATIDDETERMDAARRLAAGTDRLGMRGLFDVARLVRDQGIDPAMPEDAIRTFKVGATESPWRKGEVAARLRGTATNPDAHSFLSGRVLGQGRAITKVVDILTRAVIGLSGAHATRSASRPRGVLFFIGPTGTGKTELAKSMTELVFGSTDAYVRFDMSEFSAEHAGERLIGAPPGYVGFNAGGELTNAVRSRPYSLLLFDEIEKAHPLILDKFLQILEDGRLTDGRGTTVHFSETLIVFTSNIGFYRLSDDGMTLVPNISPGDSYETIEAKVRHAVHEFFSSQLNRPELLNRIGENVVVFDFIRPDVGRTIADQQVANVLQRVNEALGLRTEVAPAAADAIRTIATADLSFGGRGIGNVIESRFVNPLARALFKLDAASGQRVVVSEIAEGADGPKVRLK